MIHHQCRPTCAECVRDLAHAVALPRAELLPLLTRTVPVTYTSPKESTREPAAAA